MGAISRVAALGPTGDIIRWYGSLEDIGEGQVIEETV
jgi:hypothetical protein